MNLYSSEVICNSTEGSTLVDFLHSIVERRVTSFESRAKEWRASATLHLSGTVALHYVTPYICSRFITGVSSYV